LSQGLSALFLKVVGEPQVDRAIAFEAQLEAVKVNAVRAAVEQAGHEEAESELVGRTTQAGLGLFTSVLVYSIAIRGLFALAFALIHGRISSSATATSYIIAGHGFVALALVPALPESDARRQK
jgi:hypothetical protein